MQNTQAQSVGSTQAPAHRLRPVMDMLVFVPAVAALALTPTQITIGPLAPSEILLALAALLWVVRFCVVRDWQSLPPVQHWALVGAAVLSLAGVAAVLAAQPPTEATPEVLKAFHAGVQKAWTAGRNGALKEAIQLGLYILVGYTVFRSVLTDAKRIRIAVIALLATTSLAMLLATWQWFALQRNYEPDPGKRLVFGDRAARSDDPEAAPKEDHKVFGIHDPTNKEHPFTEAPKRTAYTIVQTPAQVASTFGSWNKHGYHASRTAYAGFLALVLPFALALLVQERKRWSMAAWVGGVFLLAAVSVLAGLVVPAILAGLLVTAAALGPKVGRWVLLGALAYLLPLCIISGFNQREVLREPVALQISQTEANVRYADGARHLKKFWAEQVAALNVMRAAPLFGVGAGRYQDRVDGGYDALAAASSQRLESDAQNGYLLVGMTTGLLGLAALLWLYGASIGRAWTALRAAPGNPWVAAALGALVALALLTLVTNPWVRGTAVLIAAVLAIAAAFVPKDEDRQGA